MIESILKGFEVWTDAQGIKSRTRLISVDNISLVGIARLRELILYFAIRGKLVPQNSNEESATILLKIIESENKQLEKEGKIKELKKLPDITENEKTFALPNGWEWVRFGNISIIERGGSPRPIESFLTNDPDGLNWIKIGDTDIGGKYITSTREKIKREGLIKTRMVYPGDFLLTNSMSFGRPYITNIEGCIHDGWLRIQPPRSLNKDYLYHLLSSSYVAQFFKIAAAGAVVLNLNAEKVRELPIPIPPIEEQKRIVAKVNDLMALCDQLKEQKTSNLSTHQALVKTLLETLTNASDADELQTSWKRLSLHFDTLFYTEDSIAQLKETILQLAIMGKLVKQDPKDEPGNELIERIKTEKEKLTKSGEIRKTIDLQVINADEIPYKLPENWIWSRLGSLIYYTDNLDIHKKLAPSTIINYVDIEAIDNKKHLIREVKPTIVGELSSRARRVLKQGYIIYSTVRPYLKNIAIVEDELPNMIGSTGFNVFKPLFLETSFIFYFLLNPKLNKDFENSMIGFNSPSITNVQFENTLVPVPPLREQIRLVSKIEELFALCDLLSNRINKNQELQNILSKTIVETVN